MTALPALKAPSGDGEIVAIPGLDRVGAMIERNRASIAAWPGDWPQWSREARRELLALIRPESAASLTEGSASPRILLAGHQPELFHPGVWLKNFALAGLAAQHQARAINLLIDNDAVKSLSLWIPVPGENGSPRRIELAFAHADPETPWEDAVIDDPSAFEAFGHQVAQRMRAWGFEPLIGNLWGSVLDHLKDGRIGPAFAAARRDLEQSWGCHNAEVPMSQLCQTFAFARFIGLLLADPSRFVARYNEAVRDFRRQHHLRSKNHPVPDLAREADWCELPLWSWRPDQRPVRRGRLFAQQHGDRVELRCNHEMLGVVSASRPETILALLRNPTWKIRSRALTTTLFARLFLGDLFLHGIGGGKYDELTDALFRRLWGIEAPDFLVLTGTCLLPLPVPDISAEWVTRQARYVRDLDWNPQRYLTAQKDSSLATLVGQKQHWLTLSPSDSSGRKERFRRLQELNRLLRPAVAALRQLAEADLSRARQQLAVRVSLRRRDYSFCLYPEAQLHSFCTQLL